MKNLDLHKTVEYINSIAPSAYTSSVNGTGIDLSGALDHENEVVFIVGTISDGTHTPKVQESDDNSTWSDVASSGLVGTLSNLASNTNQRVKYIGIKRYIRAAVTVSGTTNGGKYAAIVVRALRHA